MMKKNIPAELYAELYNAGLSIGQEIGHALGSRSGLELGAGIKDGISLIKKYRRMGKSDLALDTLIQTRDIIEAYSNSIKGLTFDFVCEKLNLTEGDLGSRADFDDAIKYTTREAIRENMHHVDFYIQHGSKAYDVREKTLQQATITFKELDIAPDDNEFFLNACHGNKELAEVFKNSIVEGGERSPASLMLDMQANRIREELGLKQIDVLAPHNA